MRRQWSAADIEELRGFAGRGAAAAGEHFGVSAHAAQYQAGLHGISMRRPKVTDDDRLRRRWRAKLPELKAALRAEMAVLS
jgi:hypothetical protein